jgi:hypothetical protein
MKFAHANTVSHISTPIGTSAAICYIADMLETSVRGLAFCVFLSCFILICELPQSRLQEFMSFF